MGIFADGLVDKYYSLAAAIPGKSQVFTASCNRYLMNVPTDAVKAMQLNISKVEAAARAKKGVYVDANAFGRTKVGKGLPSDMEHVLEAGLASGAIPDDQVKFAKWADENLGIDCTGFVSAYHFLCGQMRLGDSVNAGSAYFRSMALRRNPGHAYVWKLEDVEPDDVMVWMKEDGHETKKPGHIAMIYGTRGSTLLIAESSGAPDGMGHRGPRLNQKEWKDPVKMSPRYLPINEGVIIVKTINRWTPPLQLPSP